jgi:hypothetical protein
MSCLMRRLVLANVCLLGLGSVTHLHAQAVSLNPTNLNNFGNLAVGTTSTKSVLLTSAGKAPLVIKSISLPSAPYSETDNYPRAPASLVSKAEEVFELVTEGAADRLTRLLNASPASAIPAQTLQTLLNNLTLAGRTLAATAISDAAGGNATKLAKANALLAKGDTDDAAGKYVSALQEYEIAWTLLQGDE